MNFSGSRRSRFSRRTAWLIVVGWVLLVGTLAAIAPSLDSVESNDDDNPPADSMSMKAEAVARAELDVDAAPPAIVVIRTDSAASTHETAGAISAAIESADLKPVTGVLDSGSGPAGAGLVNADGTAEAVVVQLTGNPSDDEFRDAVTELRTIASDHTPDGAEVAVTGPAGIVIDAVKVFGGSDKVLLLGTVVLVIVLLFAIYRSPVLVMVSLVGVGFAMRLAEGAGALLADAGVIDISGQTASIMTVLLFGVGTDYALIIFARFREALATTDDPTVAVATAMRSVSGALLASMSTIVAAVLALLTAVTPTLHAFGPYLAVGVLSMAAVAFTLTPALLVITGRFAFWPRRAPDPGQDLPASRIWTRVADLAIDRPRRVLAAGLVTLAVLSAGLIGAQQSFDMVSGFRIDTESATGRDLLADAFGPGTIAPSKVVVRSDSPLDQKQVEDLQQGVSDAPGVEQVGATATSQDHRTIGIDATLGANPYGADALDNVPDLRDAVAAAAKHAGVDDAEVLIGGETAVAADTREALDRDLLVVGVVMLLAVALILGLVLRSLLAPLYLAVTLVASYTATMGLTAFLTITLGGDLGIGNRVAVYVLVFLVALGVDYTIFMMTRYRQELATQEPSDALRTAIVRTGGVISSAGVILAGTFAVLMTQPIRELYQFGLAMAIGILLDTFVIRPLLVPACIRLLDRHALWPSRPVRF